MTSAKMYTSKKKYKKKKMDWQNPRTNGKNKAIQTKWHKEAYTHTHKNRKRKKKKYIYIKEVSNQINKQIYQW